ncbi:hypothetical protein [Acetobacter orientalis]|nr:hypothetical protein [Acetobacter orientalis]
MLHHHRVAGGITPTNILAMAPGMMIITAMAPALAGAMLSVEYARNLPGKCRRVGAVGVVIWGGHKARAVLMAHPTAPVAARETDPAPVVTPLGKCAIAGYDYGNPRFSGWNFAPV